MKQILSYWVLMFFIASTPLIAQNASTNFGSQRDVSVITLANAASDYKSSVQALTKVSREPVITVNPMELIEEHLIPQITSQTLTITNTGTTSLDWEIGVNAGGRKNPGHASRSNGLCVDNLYSVGCAQYNDGITSWKLANIDILNIPCAGQPEWYHDYSDMVHELSPGQTYILTVTPGYNHTRIRVWIDFNDDLELTSDEIVVSDAYLLTHNVAHEVWFEVPATAPPGTHVMRVRSNYESMVNGPCETLEYGNCVDFSVNTGGGWLLVDEASGVLGAGESTDVSVTFNSTELPDGVHEGTLDISSNDAGNPMLVVPAALTVGDGGTEPLISVSPSAIDENHPNAPQITSRQLIIENQGTNVLHWDIDLDLGENRQSNSVFNAGYLNGHLLTDFKTAKAGRQSAEVRALASASINSGTKSAPTDGIECPPEAIYSQPATNNTQAHNLDEGNGFKLYQSFSNGGQVSGIRFWTVTAVMEAAWLPCDGIDPRPFDIAFFEDNNGLPGDKILDLNDFEISRVNTGEIFGVIFPIYEYTVELPGTAFIQSGWFGIQSKIGGGDPLCWNMALNQPGGMGTLLQYNSSLGYNPMDHPLGFCLIGGDEATTDVGVQRIISPSSGIDLTNTETIVLKIRNFGSAAQSNIPYSVSWSGPNGSQTLDGTFEGSIDAGQTVEVTLTSTANLATWGDYVFTACTQLPGDQGAAFDCATKHITNSPQAYCDAGVYYQTGEYISKVELGNIDNLTGRQTGVGDYTYLYADIPSGGFDIITVSSDWPHPVPNPNWDDVTTFCWVDWNKNYLYEGDNEWFILEANNAELNFSGAIVVPEGTPRGDYRMRVRLNQGTDNVPCGKLSFGEVEEYTIRVDGGTPDQWMSVSSESGSLNPGQQKMISVSFNSNNLDNGFYVGAINITSNDPNTALVEVPATLEVGNGDALTIDPISFMETHIIPPDTITTQVLNLTNNTGAPIDWELDINTGMAGREEWLNASPVSGTIAAGQSIPITLSFDSEGLTMGTYQGGINITSMPPSIFVPVTFTVISAGIGAPPVNLDGSTVNFPDIDLTWNRASGAFAPEWFSYSDESVGNAIGFGEAVNFDVAARFTPEMLANYSGGMLTNIDFVPYEPTSVCTYTIKVWQGGNNNPELVHSQAVPEIDFQDWNRVTLTQPIAIDVTKELWIGYNVNTLSGYPAGCDYGPVEEGFGNLMTWNGVWGTLTGIGGPNLSFNWSLKGYIEGNGLLVDAYNVYRKDDAAGNFDLIGSTDGDTYHYVDQNPDIGSHYYHVKALYAGGESMPSNEVPIIITAIDDFSETSGTLNIYPNPTKDQFTIKSDLEIQSVTMINNSGQLVFSREPKARELLINAKIFGKGVYSLQIETREGRSIHKVIIMQ